MGKHTDLQDSRKFPPFELCPCEDSIEIDFYDMVDNHFLVPKHHWCLLAEIQHVEYFIRLRLIVRDKSGHNFPIAFYLDDEDVDSSQFRVGYTVAILYPHQHGFLDMTTGIRQEGKDTLQVHITPFVSNFR